MADATITTPAMEIAISKYYGVRQNMMVPNVSWSVGLHECDILRLTKSRYAHEIEIKVSLSDLKADKKKRHGHHSDLIRTLTFAIPECLEQHIDEIPERAGVLIAQDYGDDFVMRCVRRPKINTACRKLTDKEYYRVCELAAMRMWRLKEKLEATP